MPTTYYLTATSDGLGGGSNFSNTLETTAPGASTISISVTTNTTETDRGYSPSGDPGTNGTTGDYTVFVVVDTGNSDLQCSVRLHRVNSSGTVQTSSAQSSEQLASAGTLQFDYTNLSLGTWAAGDRLRLDIIERDTTLHGDESLTYAIGSSGTRIVAPWSGAPSPVEGTSTGTSTTTGSATGRGVLGGSSEGTSSSSATLSSMVGVFDDDFNDASLDSRWQWYRESIADYSESGGELHLSHVDGLPVGQALWYSGFEGMLVYQLVTGDFDAMAPVRLSNDADTGLPSVSGYKVAGLQAHDPDRTIDRNYVHVGLGSIHPDESDLRAEWKTTVNSESNSGDPATGAFGSISWPSGEGQIRLTRVGDVFTMYVRPLSGGSWTQLQQVTRTDLPDELQVGLTLYSNQGTPDTTAHWDSITYAFEDDASSPISGSSAGTSTTSASLAGAGDLVAASSGTSSTAGDITADGLLAGSSAGTSTSVADPTADGLLAGTSAGTSTSSASVTGTGAMVGTSTGTSTTTGTASSSTNVTGASAGESTTTADLIGTGDLAGASVSTGESAGALFGDGALAGSSASTSASAADLDGAAAMAATSEGTGQSAGDLLGTALVAGVSSGTSMTSADLAGGGALAGASVGTSTSSLSSNTPVSGTSAGTSTTVGLLVATADLAAASDGASSSTGSLSGTVPAVGSSVGASSTTAIVSGRGLLAGASSGVGSSAGGLTIAGSYIVGASAGTSLSAGLVVATGALFGSSVGASASSGTLMDASAPPFVPPSGRLTAIHICPHTKAIHAYLSTKAATT